MAGMEENDHRGLKWGLAVFSVLICAGLFWFALQSSNQRELLTVHADGEPYKVRPDDPGGMVVPHRDKQVFGVAVGRPDQPEESLGAAPEEPVERVAEAPKPVPEPRSVPEPEPEPEPEPKPAPAPEPTPAPAPEPEALKRSDPIDMRREEMKPPVSADDSVVGWGVQLGAFSTELRAEQAWSELRKEHKTVLGGMKNFVRKPKAGDAKQLYRLWAGRFATEQAARDACAALKKAGQGCLPVWPY
jgi:cell division septation protein DedD